ncbi:hypothetical protein ACWKSP_26240 [Micromonosporaceae bacterium Da 78-11]
MTDQLDPQVDNPPSAEQKIQFCIDNIEKAPRIIKDRLKAYQAAKRILDQKMARVGAVTEGSDAAKRRAAILACADEQQARDDAYEVLQYARERFKALREELSGLQTINKSVSDAYNSAGRRW